MSSTGVEVTAGLGGFLVLFGLFLAVWFLARDLSRRLRRMRQQEELRVRDVDQQARREAAGGRPPAAAGGGASDPDGGGAVDRE